MGLIDPLHHLSGEADDASEIPFTQLSRNRPKDAGALRVLFLVDDDHGVAVEADVRAVVAPRRPLGPHDHAADHVARLDVAAGDRLLDRGDDDVTDAGVALAAAAQHLDAHALLGAGV